MESKFDWITLTIKPENPSVTFDDCIQLLSEKLLLADLFEKMVSVPRFAFFDWCIGYENITLCCPTMERFANQGVCLRISSQGLDFFKRYLMTYGIDFKQWLGEWRALSFQGYISKETRIDFAMDDIHFNDEKPILTMKKVIDCCLKGEMCKKARIVDIYDDGISVRSRRKVVNKELVVGRTVYVGSRQSDVCCRFYDKLAEQLQKKQYVPENCTSWTRCEFEFKGAKAMSVLNAFLDYDKVEFSRYMYGVINEHVSFIVHNNKNISRCPLKRWWIKFIKGCTEKFKLPHRKPARSALARADRGLTQYLSKIYTMYCEMGVVGVYKYFKKKIEYLKASKSDIDSIYDVELGNNIRDDIWDYEQMNGVKYYQYNSDLADEPEDFLEALKRDHGNYMLSWYNARHMSAYDRDRHTAFMDGCEVLY